MINWDRIITYVILPIAFTGALVANIYAVNDFEKKHGSKLTSLESRISTLEAENRELKDNAQAQYFPVMSSIENDIADLQIALEDMEAEITEGQLSCECWALPPSIVVPE